VDWPDAYRVNRYVMGLSNDTGADAALSDFKRFPAWMWRNHDVISEMAGCNEPRQPPDKSKVCSPAYGIAQSMIATADAIFCAHHERLACSEAGIGSGPGESPLPVHGSFPYLSRSGQTSSGRDLLD
jgi:erythromycin esterase-like protein